MTVAELIEKLTRCDPTLLVCTEADDYGFDADVTLYELTAHVDRRGSSVPYVSSPVPNNRIGQRDGNERVVVLTRYGHTAMDLAEMPKEL